MLYLQTQHHPLFETLRENMQILDEYAVENFHSLLRARTSPWDGADAIQRKAVWIDQHRHQLHQFMVCAPEEVPTETKSTQTPKSTGCVLPVRNLQRHSNSPVHGRAAPAPSRAESDCHLLEASKPLWRPPSKKLRAATRLSV